MLTVTDQLTQVFIEWCLYQTACTQSCPSMGARTRTTCIQMSQTPQPAALRRPGASKCAVGIGDKTPIALTENGCIPGAARQHPQPSLSPNAQQNGIRLLRSSGIAVPCNSLRAPAGAAGVDERPHDAQTETDHLHRAQHECSLGEFGSISLML